MAMAENTHKIDIVTTGNTSGSEAVKDSLNEVNQAAQDPAVIDATERQIEAQKKLDQASKDYQSSAQQSTTATGDFSAALDKSTKASQGTEQAVQQVSRQVAGMALAQGAQLLSQFGQSIAKMGESLREVDPELAKTVSSVGGVGAAIGDVLGAASTGFSAGGPWGAAMAAMVSIGGKGFAAITADAAATAQAQVELQQTIKANADELEKFATKKEGLKLDATYAKSWEGMLAMINAVNAAVQQNAQLEKERRSAAADIGESGMDAQRAIINAQLASNQITAASAAAQLADLQRQEAEAIRQSAIAEARDRHAMMQEQLEAAKRTLEGIESQKQAALNSLADAEDRWSKISEDPSVSADRKGQVQAAIESASAAAKKADEQLAEAANNVTLRVNELETSRRSLEIELSRIDEVAKNQSVVTTANALATAVEQGNAQATQLLKDAAKAADATAKQVQEQGGALTGAFAQTSAQIQSLLNDSIPDSQQTAEIIRAIGDLKNATLQKDQSIIAGLASATASLLAQKRLIDAQAEQLKQLETR